MQLLAKFQQHRSPPPSEAETLPAHEFERRIDRPSKFAPGYTTVKSVQTCPACKRDLPLNHGDRVRCSCGLFVELYGNALTIWR